VRSGARNPFAPQGHGGAAVTHVGVWRSWGSSCAGEEILTWQDVTWQDVTWQDVTWQDVTWQDVTWQDVTWQM
jgi:hypothetical protein